MTETAPSSRRAGPFGVPDVLGADGCGAGWVGAPWRPDGVAARPRTRTDPLLTTKKSSEGAPARA